MINLKKKPKKNKNLVLFFPKALKTDLLEPNANC